MLEVYSHEQATIKRIHSDIDLSSCGDLEQTIELISAKDEAAVVVDFSRCDYLDSSCLAVLIRQHRKLESRLCVVVPESARARRIFEVSGLIGILPIVDTFTAQPHVSSSNGAFDV